MPRSLDLNEAELDLIETVRSSQFTEEELRAFRENLFWRQAFCAALTGVAACPNYTEVGMLKSPIPAAKMADLALEEARKRGRI